MRKITILTLCMLLIALLAMPARAAGASLTPSASTASRGSTFTVSIQVSGAASCTACSIEVSTSSGLTLTDGTCNASGFNIDKKISEKRFLIYAMSAGNINGTVATLTFKVNDDAAMTAQNINVTMQINGQPVSAATSVTIICNHNFGAWNNAGASHTRSCTICGTPDTRAHTYSNGCDKYCNECNAVRETSHKYSTNWSSNADYHWHECTVCGDWADDVRHTPGDPATETTAQTCTVCGYEIVPAIGHIHKTDGMWHSDETGHWQNCENCEEKAEFTPHDYGTDCDSTCDTCEYEREVVHTPSEEWSTNGQMHWHECTSCGIELDAADHEADLTEEHPVCTVCGEAVTHEHSYDVWGGDESRHWHECSCGDRQGVTLHRWDDGKVIEPSETDIYGQVVFTCTVCEATKTVLAVGVSNRQNMLFWYITCGALAVALVATVTVIVVFVVKMNKKPAGKYAGRK